MLSKIQCIFLRGFCSPTSSAPATSLFLVIKQNICCCSHVLSHLACFCSYFPLRKFAPWLSQLAIECQSMFLCFSDFFFFFFQTTFYAVVPVMCISQICSAILKQVTREHSQYGVFSCVHV